MMPENMPINSQRDAVDRLRTNEALEEENTNLIKDLEQHKAITEAAKFLVSVKRHKDVKGKGAVYLASWPIALRKIEEAVDNLGEDNE